MAVEGVVKEYDQESSSKIPYLLLTVTANDTTGVYCTFPDGYETILPGLKIGQPATITGICRGMQAERIARFALLKKKAPSINTNL